MRILTMTFIAFTFLLTSCADSEMTEEEKMWLLKNDLNEREIKNPTMYLEATDVTLQRQRKKIREGGLFRDAEYADDGAIIKGDIVNKASVTTFKDAVVKVQYYSKTKTLIDAKSYVFYEYYAPNSTKPFSLKVDPPKAYNTFRCEVTSGKGQIQLERHPSAPPPSNQP